MLSWSWACPISQVRSALLWWMTEDEQDPNSVFLHMSAFVVNHYRFPSIYSHFEDIHISRWTADLLRIGSMVVLLDTWDTPEYLGSLRTVSELVTALGTGIPVRFIWPSTSQDELQQELQKGCASVLRVAESLGRFAVEKVLESHQQDVLGFRV